MHGLWDNEVFLQVWYDVIVISPLGVALRYSTWWILKGRPWLYIHVQSTLFVYLERFRCYSTFCIWLGFPYWGGGKLWGAFGKIAPKRQLKEENLLDWHILAPNCIFWAIVREIVSIGLACAGTQEKKGGRQEGRKLQKVYISRMCGATPIAGEFQPIFSHVSVSRTQSNVHNFIVIAWEVSELWGVKVSVLPYGTNAVLNNLLRAPALQLINTRTVKQLMTFEQNPKKNYSCYNTH